MDAMERRAFIKGAGMGVLAFTVGGASVMLTPGEARAQGVPFRLLKAERSRNHRGAGRDAGARRARRRHRPFHRPAGFGAAGRGAARGAHLNVKPPFVELLSRRDRRRRQGERGAQRPPLRRALRHRAARLRRPDARRTRSTAGRARPAASSMSCCAATRVDVVYGTMEGYERSACPTWPTSLPDQEVVTWQRTKKSMSSSSAPAPRARSMRRCWPRPARRSCCSTTGRTGSSPT